MEIGQHIFERAGQQFAVVAVVESARSVAQLDVDDAALTVVVRPREGRGQTNSEVRQRCAEKRLRECEGAPSVATFKAILGSHDAPENPICNHYSPGCGGFSAACTIFELGASPCMHIAPNPPCKAPFAKMGF